MPRPKSITYTYNAQGISTSRYVNGTLTQYLLDNGNVVGEVTGDSPSAVYALILRLPTWEEVVGANKATSV